MTFYCRIVIFIFSLLAIAGCSSYTNNSAYIQKSQPNNIKFNYFTVQTNLVPDLISDKTDIVSKLLSIYPQSEFITQYVEHNEFNLQPIHHFYWSNTNKLKPIFAYIRPLQKNISLPDPIETPSELFVQTKDNFLIISNQPNFFPDIIKPSNQAFLTIFSLDQTIPPPNKINENDLSTIALIDTLQTISERQPISFYFQNNQILINQTDYQTPIAETKLILKNLYSDFDQSIYQQIFQKKLFSVLSQNFLSDKIIDFNNIETLTFQQEKNNFAIFIQYPTEYNLPTLFQKITGQITQQKSYYPQYKILPDGTSSLILSPGNTNIQSNFPDDHQFFYSNQKQEKIYLTLQPDNLTISNYQPWLNQNPPTNINIPWSNLKTLYPALPDQLGFLKSIQLTISQDNYSGIINK